MILIQALLLKQQLPVDESMDSKLKYFNDPNWYLWSGHSTYDEDDPPYSAQEESDYEFYANGGR